MDEFSKVREAKAAYEAAIREYYENGVLAEVQDAARALCRADWRSKTDENKIVTNLEGGEMARCGQGEYVMEAIYVPYWVTYARMAETVLDAAKVWDAGKS